MRNYKFILSTLLLLTFPVCAMKSVHDDPLASFHERASLERLKESVREVAWLAKNRAQAALLLMEKRAVLEKERQDARNRLANEPDVQQLEQEMGQKREQIVKLTAAICVALEAVKTSAEWLENCTIIANRTGELFWPGNRVQEAWRSVVGEINAALDGKLTLNEASRKMLRVIAKVDIILAACAHAATHPDPKALLETDRLSFSVAQQDMVETKVYKKNGALDTLKPGWIEHFKLWRKGLDARLKELREKARAISAQAAAKEALDPLLSTGVYTVRTEASWDNSIETKIGDLDARFKNYAEPDKGYPSETGRLAKMMQKFVADMQDTEKLMRSYERWFEVVDQWPKGLDEDRDSNNFLWKIFLIANAEWPKRFQDRASDDISLADLRNSLADLRNPKITGERIIASALIKEIGPLMGQISAALATLQNGVIDADARFDRSLSQFRTCIENLSEQEIAKFAGTLLKEIKNDNRKERFKALALLPMAGNAIVDEMVQRAFDHVLDQIAAKADSYLNSKDFAGRVDKFKGQILEMLDFVIAGRNKISKESFDVINRVNELFDSVQMRLLHISDYRELFKFMGTLTGFGNSTIIAKLMNDYRGYNVAQEIVGLIAAVPAQSSIRPALAADLERLRVQNSAQKDNNQQLPDWWGLKDRLTMVPQISALLSTRLQESQKDVFEAGKKVQEHKDILANKEHRLKDLANIQIAYDAVQVKVDNYLQSKWSWLDIFAPWKWWTYFNQWYLARDLGHESAVLGDKIMRMQAEKDAAADRYRTSLATQKEANKNAAIFARLLAKWGRDAQVGHKDAASYFDPQSLQGKELKERREEIADLAEDRRLRLMGEEMNASHQNELLAAQQYEAAQRNYYV